MVGRANAANTYTCLDIPAGHVILAVHLTVIEPANTTMSIKVGDGSNDDGYVNDSDMTAAAGTNYVIPNGTDEALLIGTVGGNALTSAGTIVATQTASTVLTAGKFIVSAVVAGIQ
jgi:hypothetical protein